MAKTEKRRKSPLLAAQTIMRAVAPPKTARRPTSCVLDLRKAAGFTDFFLICSGGNARQIRAIADAVDRGTRVSRHQTRARRRLRAVRLGAA